MNVFEQVLSDRFNWATKFEQIYYVKLKDIYFDIIMKWFYFLLLCNKLYTTWINGRPHFIISKPEMYSMSTILFARKRTAKKQRNDFLNPSQMSFNLVCFFFNLIYDISLNAEECITQHPLHTCNPPSLVFFFLNIFCCCCYYCHHWHHVCKCLLH